MSLVTTTYGDLGELGVCGMPKLRYQGEIGHRIRRKRNPKKPTPFNFAGPLVHYPVDLALQVEDAFSHHPARHPRIEFRLQEAGCFQGGDLSKLVDPCVDPSRLTKVPAWEVYGNFAHLARCDAFVDVAEHASVWPPHVVGEATNLGKVQDVS
jgi:hypothetical protein